MPLYGFSPLINPPFHLHDKINLVWVKMYEFHSKNVTNQQDLLDNIFNVTYMLYSP